MKRGGWAVAGVAAVAAIGGGIVMRGGGEETTGRASITDGDTLIVANRTIRLWGVDAPEAGQNCTDASGHAWRCGQQAALALADHVGTRPVSCEAVEQDRYGRDVARCSVGGADLGRWLVQSGWAFDYTGYSKGRYAADEARARSARLGVWRGAVTPPWEWRAAGRTRASVSSPAPPPEVGCQLKGNINAAGRRIVHSPGQHDYEATRIDTSAGERWFCSLAEAQAAGWRTAAR